MKGFLAVVAPPLAAGIILCIFRSPVLALLVWVLFNLHTKPDVRPELPRIPDLLTPAKEQRAELIALKHDQITVRGYRSGLAIRHAYTATFLLLDSGEYLRVPLSERKYQQLSYPARGTLKMKGGWFRAFTPD